MAILAPTTASGSGSGENGLKGGALGLVASIVVGMASTAPAYSLAAPTPPTHRELITVP